MRLVEMTVGLPTICLFLVCRGPPGVARCQPECVCFGCFGSQASVRLSYTLDDGLVAQVVRPHACSVWGRSFDASQAHFSFFTGRFGWWEVAWPLALVEGGRMC